MKKHHATIDPSSLRIGRDAPFRYRRYLPGEASAGAEPPPCDTALVESVARCGLLHPPLILGEPPAVLCGHRRIAAARIAGLTSIDVLSLDASPEEAIPLWLEDARYGIPLSDLELILLISRYRTLSGEAFDTGRLSAMAGRDLSPPHVERLERLIELPDDVLDALHGGRLSTGDLLTLSESDAIDPVRAARLLAGASLKRAERREAARLILRLGDLGNWNEFEEAGVGKDGGLLHALRASCTPTRERDMVRIEEIADRLGLPAGASLQPPENLEGGGYRLSARIRDERELDELLGKLRAALERGDIGRLLDILKGR